MTTKTIRVKTLPQTPPIDRLALVQRVAELSELAEQTTQHVVANPPLRTSGLAVAQRCYSVAASLRLALETGASDAELFGLSLVANEAEANAHSILARVDFADLDELGRGPSPVVLEATQ